MMLFFWTALALASPLNPYAAQPDPTVQTANPFAFSATPPSVKAGGKGVLLVGGMVPPGTLLYRDMLEVSVADAGGLEVGEVRIPPGTAAPDPAFDGQLRAVFSSDLIVEVEVTAPADFESGQVVLDLHYQGCRDSLCYPPTREELVVPVAVSK